MSARFVLALILYLLIEFCNCKHIFVVDSYSEGAENDLVSVVVLYRHGDRSPISSFPNDPYFNSSYWPEGYGQLLKKGILRQYHLGQWLRNRYDNFLPSEYSSIDFQIYSTDVDRTLMSAQSNLAGLYPPPTSDIWDEDLIWEPIPVHLMATEDPVLAMNGACPKFDKLQKELETSEFFKNISQENNDLFSSLSKFTGMDVTTLNDVQTIYDVFYVYSKHNASYIPSWADDLDMDKITYLSGLEFAKPTFTTELRRLRAGPFFNYLIDHFDNVINNVTELKLLMLSGHDSTISSVLGGMETFDNYPPNFASMVVWELRKNANEYYINVLYKRNSTDSFDELNVHDCKFDCSFDDFKTNLESVNVDSTTWQEECTVSSSTQVTLSWLSFLILMTTKLMI